MPQLIAPALIAAGASALTVAVVGTLVNVLINIGLPVGATAASYYERVKR